MIIIKLCGGCLHRCNSNLIYCKLAPTILPPAPLQKNEGVNVIPTHDLSISAAVLYQLSYKDPYIPLAEQSSTNAEAIS